MVRIFSVIIIINNSSNSYNNCKLYLFQCTTIIIQLLIFVQVHELRVAGTTT